MASSPHILAVDDSDLNLDAIEAFLHGSGCVTSSAHVCELRINRSVLQPVDNPLR